MDQNVWMEKSINQLDIIGLYSRDRYKLFRLQFSFLLTFIQAVVSILDLIYNCTKKEHYLELITTLIPSTVTLVFMTLFIVNRKELHGVIEVIRTGFIQNSFALEAERFEIQLVKYSQYFIYGTFGGYALISVQSYLDRKFEPNPHDGKANGLPYRAWYPLDLRLTSNFCFCFLLQEITTFIGMQTAVPIAVCFASILNHLKAQLQYLQQCVSKICEDLNNSQTLLLKCLKLHFLLIDFTAKVQSAFSNILLFHNYAASLVISVTTYQASIMSVFNLRFIPNFSITTYALAEAFMYCYFGQHIINHSTLIGMSAYNNKWYNSSPEITNNLRMLIRRSQKPLCLVFFGSIKFSLETFYNILRVGYTFFIFLTNISKPKEM